MSFFNHLLENNFNVILQTELDPFPQKLELPL